MKTLLHTIFPRLCRRHLQWVGKVLYCQKCGEPVAFRYCVENETRVYVFEAYRKSMLRYILDMPETRSLREDGEPTALTVSVGREDAYKDIAHLYPTKSYPFE